MTKKLKYHHNGIGHITITITMIILLYICLAALPVMVSCGRQDLDSRMKGGLKLDKGMYRFVGKVVQSGKQVCTCVLVDQRWILTLKTCIDKSSLPEYSVHFNDFDNGKFIIRQLRKIKELKGRKSSVILVELSIIIQRKVPSIAVFDKKGNNIKSNTQCEAVGFSSNGKFLHKAKLTTQPSKECSRSTCKDNLLFDARKGALCQSDNGAPIFCRVKNKWHFTALTFVKKGCQKKDVQSLRLSFLGESIRRAIMEEQELCVTAGCVTAAATLIERMDKDVNPCDNFYQFACGRWLKMTAIPEGFDLYSIFNELQEDVINIMKYELKQPNQPDDIEVVNKAKGYYKSCLDTAKIESDGNGPLHNLMEQLGGLPLLGSKSGGGWNSSAYSFEDLFVMAFQATTSMPLLSVHVTEVTLFFQERYQFNFDQPTLPLPRQSYLNGQDDAHVKAYKKYLLDIYKEFGANETTAAEYAEYTINLEIDLANISADLPYANIRSVNGGYLFVKKKQVDHLKIVEQIYQLIGLTYPWTDYVTIVSFDYFSKLDNVLEQYPDKVIANYIITKVVMTHFNFMPQVYIDITRRFLEEIGVKPVGTSTRQKYCLDMVEKKMPDVTRRIFAGDEFPKSEIRYILDMAEQNKKVFKKIMENSDWMSDFSKNASKEKIDNMDVKVGYPKRIYDDKRLNKIHKEFTVDTKSSYQTSINMAKSKMLKELASLKKKLQPLVRDSLPLNVNAYYSADRNLVELLAGVLQPNVYSQDTPEYMNFGGVGMLIGHEITHGFTYKGIKYDKDGTLQQWWKQEDILKYDEIAKYFIDTWSNFTIPGTGGAKNNGLLTFNEVLCDHEGMRISYKAYREKVEKVRKGKEEQRLPGLPYTPNQVFFLNVAHSFCHKLTDDFKQYWIQNIGYPVHSLRINGLMQNSKGFAEAWRCPVGSYMNPADKCSFY